MTDTEAHAEFVYYWLPEATLANMTLYAARNEPVPVVVVVIAQATNTEPVPTTKDPWKAMHFESFETCDAWCKEHLMFLPVQHGFERDGQVVERLDPMANYLGGVK